MGFLSICNNKKEGVLFKMFTITTDEYGMKLFDYYE